MRDRKRRFLRQYRSPPMSQISWLGRGFTKNTAPFAMGYRRNHNPRSPAGGSQASKTDGRNWGHRRSAGRNLLEGVRRYSNDRNARICEDAFDNADVASEPVVCERGQDSGQRETDSDDRRVRGPQGGGEEIMSAGSPIRLTEDIRLLWLGSGRLVPACYSAFSPCDPSSSSPFRGGRSCCGLSRLFTSFDDAQTFSGYG